MKKAIAMLLAAAMVMSFGVTAYAAGSADNAMPASGISGAQIDTSKTGSIQIYAYDFTNAEKDSVWDKDSYISTGVKDTNVEATLGTSSDTTDYYGNGYALKGNTFSYLNFAELVTYTSKNGTNSNSTELLYKAAKNDNTAAVLKAIGLTAADAYPVVANAASQYADTANYLYFESGTLTKALRDSLAANSTDVKDALEAITFTGTFAETDINGQTKLSNLPLGLYLLVETKVAEGTTSTTNPFFVSVPMTSVNGSNVEDDGNVNTAGGGKNWIYDVVLYPKNETGIPSLELTVREAAADTATWINNNNGTDIDEGYAHNATASENDVVEYQTITTLPSITSKATNLSTYTLVYTLDKGIEFDKDKDNVVIEFFKDKGCSTANRVSKWSQADTTPMFTVAYGEGENDATTMTIAMTAKGLEAINGGDANRTDLPEEELRRGYSDLTMRVTYSGTVNDDKDTVVGDLGNTNEVQLAWVRTNTTAVDYIADDCHVYTYGVDLTKLFKDTTGAVVDAEYSNVKFVVYNKTDKYWVSASYDEDAGVYYVNGHIADDAGKDYVGKAATVFEPNGADAANKKQVVILGLEDDEYIITEVRTDDKYTLLKEDIDVLITIADTEAECDFYASQDSVTLVHNLIQNDPRFKTVVGTKDEALVLGWTENVPQTQLSHILKTASATVDGNAVTMTPDNLDGEADKSSVNALAPMTVVNTQGFDLPRTGSFGNWMFPVIGISVMCCAAFVVVIALKKKQKEQA